MNAKYSERRKQFISLFDVINDVFECVVFTAGFVRKNFSSGLLVQVRRP